MTIPMTASLRRLLWIPRLMLLAVFLSHGIGKITAYDAFQNKFALSDTSVILLILAEIGGSIGISLAGFLRGRWGLYATWAGVVPLVASQVGAIVVARWPRWYEMYTGSEYNFTLLAMLAVLGIGHYLAWTYGSKREPRSSRLAGPHGRERRSR